jgi:hypothetical protein
MASLRASPYDCGMKTLKARVKGGRLTMSEPTELPDGTEIQLTIADERDDLDDDERAALHAALRRSWISARRGQLQPADALLGDPKDRE